MTKQLIRGRAFDMCSAIRMGWPSEVLACSGDPEIMLSTRLFIGIPTSHIYIQRCAHKEMFDSMKKMKCKKILDFDDMLFRIYGEGLPEYNFCNKFLDVDKTTEALKYGLSDIDQVTVTTEFLKQGFIDTFGYKNVQVIPNYLPRWIYHFDRAHFAANEIQRPRVVYAGGPTHFGQDKRDTGDFSQGLIEFLRSNIDKMDLIFVGMIPWFLEDLKSRISVTPYVNVMQLPRLLSSLHADFYLAPLRESVFNKCKSNLKYLEACTIGAICLGSDFPDSPYSMIDERAKFDWNMSAKEIGDKFWNLCNPSEFNKVLSGQYQYIDKMWLENNAWQYAELLKE